MWKFNNLANEHRVQTIVSIVNYYDDIYMKRCTSIAKLIFIFKNWKLWMSIFGNYEWNVEKSL